MSRSDIPRAKARSKGARYTPVSKRQDRPDAISWLLRHHPDLADAQISRLLGTTKPTINSIRSRSHWNMANIKPQNPVTLGLCTEADLEKALVIAERRAERSGVQRPKAKIEPDPIVEVPPEKPAEKEITAENLFRSNNN